MYNKNAMIEYYLGVVLGVNSPSFGNSVAPNDALDVKEDDKHLPLGGTTDFNLFGSR